MNVKIGNLISDAMLYSHIAHGCNCFCVMGGGIANDIRKNFPEAYEADCVTPTGDFNKLGCYTMAQHIWIDSKPFKPHFTNIYNLYTQYDTVGPMPRVVYPALELALMKMRTYIESNEIHRNPHIKHNIGIPLIGYGLAGGDLSKIMDIITRTLFGMDYTLYVWDGDPNAQSIYDEITSKLF